MENVIFRTSLLRGPKGDRGETGAPDSVPKDGVIAYDGDDLPEGYVEIEELDVYGDLMNEMASLDARLDIVESLPEGSTTMDAELVDIRYGANGKTYQTAGKAVRGQIDEVNENMEWYQEKDKTLIDNATLTGQASGEIASFDMGGDAPLKECVIQIEPKQDLHGQDYPYPAGAGKNKLPLTVEGIKAANTAGTWSGNAYALNGVTFTVQTDDDGNVTGIKIAGTTTSATQLDLCDMLFSAGDYILTDDGTVRNDIYTFVIDGGATNNPSRELNFSFSESVRRLVGIYVLNGATFSDDMLYPMIRLATETDPTFAPSSNICPIGGYYQSEVDNIGINQWDEEWEVGGIEYASGQNIVANDRIRSKGYIRISPNTNYYYIFPSGGAYFFYDNDKNFISVALVETSGVVSTPSNANYTRFALYSSYGTTYNHNISINYPPTVTTYQPYNGYTKPVPFSNKNLLPSHLKYDSFDIWSGAQALKEINPTDSADNRYWFGNVYYIGGATVRVLTDENDPDVVRGLEISRSTTGESFNFFVYKLESGELEFDEQIDFSVNATGDNLGQYSCDALFWYKNGDSPVAVHCKDDEVKSPLSNNFYAVYIKVDSSWSGEAYFYPMVSLHSDTDKTFMPYYNGLQLIGGRVYKGYVDPVNMRLTVTGAEEDLGSREWTRLSTSQTGKYRFSSTVSGIKQNPTSSSVPNWILSSNYRAVSPDDTYGATTGVSVDMEDVVVYDDNLAAYSAEDFKTAMSGVQLVYDLANPRTYGINNTELKSLLGVNNISADTGEIAVTFRKDANLVINSLIARIEALEGGNA